MTIKRITQHYMLYHSWCCLHGICSITFHHTGFPMTLAGFGHPHTTMHCVSDTNSHLSWVWSQPAASMGPSANIVLLTCTIKKNVNMDQSPYHSEECLIHVDVFVKETSTERKSTWHTSLKQILYCNQAHAYSLFSRVETAGCILSCPDFIS